MRVESFLYVIENDTQFVMVGRQDQEKAHAGPLHTRSKTGVY